MYTSQVGDTAVLLRYRGQAYRPLGMQNWLPAEDRLIFV